MSHHPMSPSKLDRIAGCPWSYQNCHGWESDDGEDANRGTLLHRAIYDDEVYNGLSSKDREMIDAIRDEHIKPYAGMERYSELSVQVFDEDGRLLTEGTLDDLTISRDGTKANLKDWKFGSYEVSEAEQNKQAKAYVCGVFRRFPKVQVVYVMIVQPVYGMANYDAQCEFRRGQMPELLAEIREIERRAKSATEADANPTADNCRYCNKNRCAAFKAKMAENFSVMTIFPDRLSVEEQEMTVDFADRLLCAESEIKAAMKAKTDKARELLLSVGGSANFRVQAGRVTKKTDWDSIAEKHGITDEEIAECTTEKEGDPYLMPRMRKRPNINAIEQ